MKTERAILIAFLGNYLVNTVAAALVALIPAGGATGYLTPQYIAFVVLAVVVVAVLAWWYLLRAARGFAGGIAFGGVGFLVAIATAFVSGIGSVLGQTGSLSSVASVLPNFGPFLLNWTTLVLLCYWIIPAGLVGWLLKPKAASTQSGMPM